MTVHLRRLAFVALVIVLGAGSVACPPAIADTGAADPLVDQLAEAAETPTLGWADCDDGFLCATAEVPLDYNRPRDEQIELAVIKLPATDPQNRIGTLFINFGGPGQSGVDRLRGRARWPWLFSEELRSRFDLVSWDQRGVARSAAVRCFPDAAEQWRFLVPSPGLPMDPLAVSSTSSLGPKSSPTVASSRAGPILNHASSANSARDLELLRRAVGDASLTYHGISYGTQLGAIYANLFPGRVRAMVVGRINRLSRQHRRSRLRRNNGPAQHPARYRCRHGRGLRGILAGLFGSRSALRVLRRRSQRQWAALAERSRMSPVVVYGHPWTYPEMVVATLAKPTTYPQLAELLQQFSETGTAAPELIDAITGSDPPPTDVDKLYLGNREEAYDAIQCSDSSSAHRTLRVQPSSIGGRRGVTGLRPHLCLRRDAVRVLARPRRRPLHGPMEPTHFRANSGAQPEK